MRAEVSVVIPSIGRPSLVDAVDSARSQGVDVEVIVVDDSGSDAVEPAGMPGVRVLRTPGRVGAAAARNLGMRAATAPLLAFLDDDDVWLPGHLQDAVRTLAARPAATIYAACGLVLDEHGAGRVAPSVLVGDRTVARYFFERPAWRSRNRRILTPTLVFRDTLKTHLMEPGRAVNEDTWWLLTAERDRGARLVQSAHVGVVVHGSAARTGARWSDDLGSWLDDVDRLHPGAAATEQLTMLGRPAVRAGDPAQVARLSRDVLSRPGGWTWTPVLALHGAAALGRAGLNRLRDRRA